jgi:IclR family KDG regulon transcriptional repressor
LGAGEKDKNREGGAHLSQQEGGQRLIQAVQRAIDILECFDSPDMELPLGELSSKVDLNKSTAHGILATLVHNGYIYQNPETGRYKLGPRFLEKSLQMLGKMSVYQTVHPHLVRITEEYQQTSHLFLYVNEILFCADKVEAAPFVVLSSRIGCQLPFHATASGKVVLANVQHDTSQRILSELQFTRFTPKTICSKDVLMANLFAVRVKGYGVEDEEIEMGTYSIAVPIWNYQGLLGTISVSGMKNRMITIEDDIIRDLMEAAASISREFGYIVPT